MWNLFNDYDGSSAFKLIEDRRVPMVECIVVAFGDKIEYASPSERTVFGAGEATWRFGIKPNIAVGIAFADMWWQ